ncbi:MAG: CehA/McbA family metallohydrolase [Planctomyces sp.]|nr:CehA/McbA family metallohydrolase [Planctomyces sp.]
MRDCRSGRLVTVFWVLVFVTMLPHLRLGLRSAEAASLSGIAISLPDSLEIASQETEPTSIGQPLAANAARLRQALEYLGAPLDRDSDGMLSAAIADEDSAAVQAILDPLCLVHIHINPELRVKVHRGRGDAVLQQAGFTPVLIKVQNDATLARALRISSPQAGAVYSGPAVAILERQAQTELADQLNPDRLHRFLDVEMFHSSPMTTRLSGLRIEYCLALIHCSEAGQREATIVFDVGEGTQDLGFRSEVPILFSIRPAVPVKLMITDHDGAPTAARLEFRDVNGRVYPPQAKRLAPDFFFQPQIYRHSGGTVLLPPGEFRMEASRGPEYFREVRSINVPDPAEADEDEVVIDIALKRWIRPDALGYFSGDHHIHGAGCSHYDSPTQGVTPRDMFAQVKGEGLNVGCVLTWGPCFDHQRNFFSPLADDVSEPLTLIKYDLEISGFGSAALGHVCLLNLKDQTYPGSNGTKTEGWPAWTVPVMRWAKEQGGFTGYPHSALHVDPESVAAGSLEQGDEDQDGRLTESEAQHVLLPEPFHRIDSDLDKTLSAEEIRKSADRAADVLPNYALPAMDGGGAMEIVVSTPEGACDFISAMDTARIPEWNTWYHLMNCGFPLKLSGETDFPCMSSRRVGQGRVYVQLGRETKHIDFSEWCRGLAQGRSYVSDGYAHAMDFTVQGIAPGTADVVLTEPRMVTLEVKLAFAPEQPIAVAYGTLTPPEGKRMVGDTVHLHAPRETEFVHGGDRVVEVIMNGQVVAQQSVPADGNIHQVNLNVEVTESCWIAVRQFPQLHTNPVQVIVAGEPIRASRKSALWCAESVRLLWKNRQRFISESERPEARKAYERALETFHKIAAECEAGAELCELPTSLESRNRGPKEKSESETK